MENFIFVLMKFLTNNILFRRIAILISQLLSPQFYGIPIPSFKSLNRKNVLMEILAAAQKELLRI